MRLWQKILAAVVTGALIFGAVAGWGSLGSMACLYGLLIMGAALLTQKFINNRSGDDYTME